MSEIELVVLTAVCSSVLTCVLWLLLAYLLLRWRGASLLNHLQQRSGQEVEARVHAGAVAAGNELLPQIRAEVTQGFLAALKQAPTAEVAAESLSNMAKSGSDALGAGLEALLKGRPPR